jgi:predicted dithiol-disulfide oxidoreductase (DUF899 family)
METINNFLDLTPKGCNEVKGMEWMRLHDHYGSSDRPSSV